MQQQSAKSQTSLIVADYRSLDCLLGSNIDDTAAKSLFYNIQRTIIKRDNNNVMTHHHRHQAIQTTTRTTNTIAGTMSDQLPHYCWGRGCGQG